MFANNYACGGLGMALGVVSGVSVKRVYLAKELWDTK